MGKADVPKQHAPANPDKPADSMESPEKMGEMGGSGQGIDPFDVGAPKKKIAKKPELGKKPALSSQAPPPRAAPAPKPAGGAAKAPPQIKEEDLGPGLSIEESVEKV